MNTFDYKSIWREAKHEQKESFEKAILRMWALKKKIIKKLK